jgi:hypothetical protein
LMKRDVIRSSIFGCLNESRIWRIEWILILTLFLSFFPFFWSFSHFRSDPLFFFFFFCTWSTRQVAQLYSSLQQRGCLRTSDRCQRDVSGPFPLTRRHRRRLQREHLRLRHVQRPSPGVHLNFISCSGCYSISVDVFCVEFSRGGRRACLSDQQRKNKKKEAI